MTASKPSPQSVRGDDRPEVELRCSFCGKPEERGRRLIPGMNWVAICQECVAVCNDILGKGKSTSN